MRVSRRVAVAMFGSGSLTSMLGATEAWTKDPASWDEKDLAKILTDSPWAQKVQVALGSGLGGAGGGGVGRGAGTGGGLGGGDDPTGQLSGPGGGPGGGMGGAGGGGRRGGGGPGGVGEGGGMQSMTFTVRWMSAPPMKQAIVRSRMGKEADTSPQAKEFLERKETHYTVALIGPPRDVGGGGGRGGGGGAGMGGGAVTHGSPEDRAQRMTEQLKEATALLRKGKQPIRPETVQVPQQGQNSYLFLFPRTDAIALDDKEVEFATRMGPLEVKHKFKLKDMVYGGQLAL